MGSLFILRASEYLTAGPCMKQHLFLYLFKAHYFLNNQFAHVHTYYTHKWKTIQKV